MINAAALDEELSTHAPRETAMEQDGGEILVPLDGSTSDLPVLALAAAMAAQLRSRLVLMRVVKPCLPSLSGGSTSREERRLADAARIAATEEAVQRVDRELAALQAAIPGAGAQRVLLVSTAPSRRIVEWIRAHPVQLVLTARPSHAGLGRLVHSSVAERLERSRLAPVMSGVHDAGGCRPILLRKRRSGRRPIRCARPVRHSRTNRSF